jgi:hypothetical protein
MTTIPLERLIEVPASTGHGQHSLVDPYDEPHAILGIRVIVSRDHLAAAVELAGHNMWGSERHPDEWTVDEVRYLAEFNLLHMSALELQQGAEGMAQMASPDFYDPEAHEVVLAVYRAVDRAYPKLGAGR